MNKYAALALLAASACASDAKFATNFSPDFAAPHHAVSVFGVYKDGQMSTEAWTELEARIAPVLGARTCAAAYAGGASAAGEPLASEIAEYARANGPTDALLEKISPAAQGDLILVLTDSGKLPKPEKYSVNDSQAGAPQSGASMGRGAGTGGRGLGGRGGLSSPSPRPGSGEGDMLEMSALLYSVPKQKSVARIDMQYTGDSVDAALSKFATRLAQSLPTATCSGWTWNGKVDPDQIRRLGESAQ